MSNLVFVGGTGGLGYEVAKGLRTATGFDNYKALVRPESADGEKAQGLRGMQWEIVPLDFSDTDAIECALAGAKVVVSTLSGNNMVTLEKAIIDAAKKVGASLFVPSQFGVDYRRWDYSFPLLAGKKAVVDYATEQELPILTVFTGMFSDIIFSILADPSNAKARVVGDGTEKYSFTKRSDIGFVLAKALEDPEVYKGGALSFQGTTMPWKDGLALLGKAIGKDIEIEALQPEAALEEEQALLKKGLGGDMGAFYGSFVLHLLGTPVRGKSGADVSAESKSYGVALEPLEKTLEVVYGKN